MAIERRFILKNGIFDKYVIKDIVAFKMSLRMYLMRFLEGTLYQFSDQFWTLLADRLF